MQTNGSPADHKHYPKESKVDGLVLGCGAAAADALVPEEEEGEGNGDYSCKDEYIPPPVAERDPI